MKILLAEQSRAVSTALRRLLEDTGYTVEIAYDGVQALEYLQNDSYDLLITEIDLARIDGRTLVQRAFAHGVIVPAIGILPASEVTRADLVQNADFEALLPKPYPADALLSLVKMLSEEEKGDHAGLSFWQRRLMNVLSTDRTVRYRELSSILPELYGTVRAFIAATDELLARNGSEKRIVATENGYTVRAV